MNKKFKLAIPFAVLALTCGIAAGCKPVEEHTHSYTQWAHDENQHWKVCPDDNAVDESSKEDHVFIAGECDCGATQAVGPVVEAKYGTVTGKVKLYKQGAYVTDLAGIKVDMGNDDVEIKGSVADGSYQFTVSNVKVGTTYNLTITKTGYQSYSTEIELEEEGEEAKIGGTNGVTLEYEVFGLLCSWDGEYHDFSHVNDDDPYVAFLESDGGKTFNVLTKDSYNDVSASLKVEYGNSLHSWHTQGIVLKFEDGKHLIVRYHNGDQVNGNIQYTNNAWDACKAEDSLFGEDAGLNEWGEAPIHTLLNEETAAIKAEGLDLNVVLKDGTLYSFFGGKFIGKYALPAGYADKKVQVGYFAFNPANNVKFKYDISADVPATMSTTLDINVIQPQGVTGCAVTATPQKASYDFGEQIELTFTAQEGYKLESLTVGGVDRLNAVVNGKLTITADRPDLDITATFAEEQPIALKLTVKGKKLGTTAALAEGTVVEFKGTDYSFTVGADGKIKSDAVAKGRYIVSVAGYQEKEIDFSEDLTEVVLEYNTFKDILGWGSFDFSKQNDATPEIGITNDCSAIFTNDIYDSVKASIYLKGDQMSSDGNAGILFRFVGEGMNDVVAVRMEKTDKVQFEMTDLWGSWTTHGSVMAAGTDWQDLIFFTGDNADAKSAEYLEAYQKGTLKLSVVRKGATFYVYLGDTYIGQRTFDAKYANAKCEVGFISENLGNTSEWKRWKIEITQDTGLEQYTVTNATAENAHGILTGIPAQAAEKGDTITLTIAAEDGYKLSALKVNGVDVTAQVTGTTYSFVVTGDTTVEAEFTQISSGSVNAQISGSKFGVAENSLTDGTEVTLSCAGLDDVTTTLKTVDGSLTLAVENLSAGVWTVNIAGYQPQEFTVEKNATYTEAIVLKPVEEFSLIQNWGSVNSVIADDGSANLTITNEMETAVSNTAYGDISITVDLSGTNMTKDGNTGTQGIVLRFSDNKLAVLRMEGRTKIQFAYSTEWFQGGSADGSGWQDLLFFSENDRYLTAFDKGELQMTAVRKGATIYAILTVDGKSEIIGCRTFDEKYLNDKAKVGMYCEGTVNGAAKTWKFAIGNADAALAAATPAVGTDKISYLGNWTDRNGTLAVAGKGYVEFKADAGTVKESVTMKLAAANATSEQGIVYRFADGKYVAIRYQKTDDGAKVQFTMDTVLLTNASLVGWIDYAMTADEIAAFNGSGIDLTLVRDGNKFYVVLGERVLGVQTVDQAKYATADGNMGIMIWEGSNAAFAYEHKTGDDVTVPAE